MKLAIMQPYVFPYIGYFQLIQAVDKFLLLDSVNFIKKGWINRNRIIVNGTDDMFSVPLSKVSQNKSIIHTYLHKDYSKWCEKFLLTLTHSYKHAPYFGPVFDLVNRSLTSCSAEDSISALAFSSLQETADYLGITTELIPSSDPYDQNGLKAQTKIIDICKQLGATDYYNLNGGKDLYSFKDFTKEGLRLHFVASKPIKYKQYSDVDFIPWLSILDVIMFNSPQETLGLLSEVNIYDK